MVTASRCCTSYREKCGRRTSTRRRTTRSSSPRRATRRWSIGPTTPRSARPHRARSPAGPEARERAVRSRRRRDPQSTLKIRSGVRSAIPVRPQRPIVVRTSSRRISKARATPAAPSAARPHRIVRPIATIFAPRANAFTTSVPREKPPSTTISARPATASTMGGSASMVDCVWSSWRPPWLETQIRRTPMSTARRASRTVMIPLVVELEHLRRLAGLGDLLDWPPGGAAQPLERVGLRRPTRHLHIALGVEEDEAAHGRDGHRPRERHAEEARAEVDLAHIDEDVLGDGQTVEVAAVAAARRLRLGAAVAEVPRLARQALAGGATDLGQRDEARGPRSLAHGVVLYALVSDPRTGGGASQSTLGRTFSSPSSRSRRASMTRPPSTLIACPVMYAARLPARKAITLATSSGRSSRPSGTCARRCRVNSSGGRPRRAPCSRATTVHMSVSTKPGHTQFTRIPSLA